MIGDNIWSPNALQWLDLKLGHSDDIPRDGRQADLPY